MHFYVKGIALTAVTALTVHKLTKPSKCFQQQDSAEQIYYKRQKLKKVGFDNDKTNTKLRLKML